MISGRWLGSLPRSATRLTTIMTSAGTMATTTTVDPTDKRSTEYLASLL